MNKSLVIGGAVAFLLIIIVGGYFFTRPSELDTLTTKKNTLLEDFNIAEAKLSKEKETLSTMTSDLRSSFPLAIYVQDQMKKASSIVKRTDFMFSNSSGPDPKIIVINPLTGIPINTERNDVNLLLSQWQTKIDILSVEKIDLSESEKIKKEIETIKSFINDLSKIIGSLTPQNSGLSQFQIDTYSLMLPPAASIDEVLASFSPITLSNQTPPGSPNMPTVTPADVIVQQEVVEEVETQVAALEEQIIEIEEQIEQISPSLAPAPSPSPQPEVIPPGTATPPTPTTPEPTPPPAPVSPGIIVQPGAPELIQGTNPF